MLNGGFFPLRLGTREQCPLFVHLSNIVLEDFNKCIETRQVNQWFKYEREEIKLSFFMNDMIVNIKKNQKNY